MLRGDISNVSPSRWLVTLDCLLEGKRPKKTLLKSWDQVARATPLNVLSLGRLWRASRYGMVFEMVVFGGPDDYVIALEENLERWGVHPIRGVTGYEDRKHLQSALAYRPDVQAVIDEPDKYLAWGGKGIALTELG